MGVPVTLDQSGAVSMVRLEGEVGIGDALELKGALLDGLALRRGLRIDVAVAMALDVTIFQLLWAGRHAAGEAGMEFSVSGPVAQEIVLTMDRAGLEKFPVVAG
jgi:anti-anti-sigma regulatory factor